MEKDLASDPRVYAMALQVCNGQPLQHGITLIVGALARLWILGDTHINDDDVLPLSVELINQIVGIENFGQILPSDWFQVVDTNHVKLPNFHVHNGTIAKERALNNQRITRFRKKSNASPLRTVTAAPLQAATLEHVPDLDQDLDLRKEKTKQKRKRKTQIQITPDTVPGLDVAAWDAWVTYRKERKPAIRGPSLLAAAKQMAALGTGQGAAVNFSMANGYQGLIAPKNGNGTQHVKPNDQNAELDALRRHAHAIGFRDPHPLEAPGAYRTDMKLWETKPQQYRELFKNIKTIGVPTRGAGQ
jgi:hypothetical protein